jgi:hypothetical protein
LTTPKTDLIFQDSCMSKRPFSYFALLLGMFFLMQGAIIAQNDLSSEEALRKEAKKTYDDEDYSTALKLYSRLLSVNLKDPLYNYRYGVCLLEASPDKDEAIKYIEKAVNNPEAEKETFFNYGRVLQLNYRFNDAIAAFTKYKSLVSESKAKKMQVDHYIETCKNGKSLLRKITDLQVLDKKDLNDKDFFLSYDLSDIGGRLLVKPDDFKTALDKKKKESSIIFLSQDKSEIYFSSYGSSDENGKDIYVIKLLPNGEYSKPVSLGYPINTEFDEDYPFLHPNGKVLYFASKGHNSMGGYDIFKSERNDETGTWSKPVNLDFAINTPDDDILYVTDKDEKLAYFASRRGSENGRIDVYHINTERKPVDICIFKGKFIPRQTGQSLAAKITVKNVDANEVESVVKSNESSGEYTLNLPNGGKYLITVETAEGDVQSDVLVIPQQFETVPIRQEIAYKEDENGKMHLNTFFGQSLADDDRYALPIEFIKDRSKLDVNVNKDSKDNTTSVLPEKKDSVAVTDTTSTKPKKKDLSNEDLIHIAENDAKDMDKDAKDARDAADKALVIVNEKNQKAQELGKKVEDANTSAAAMTDPAQKQIEQSRADALQLQANTAETEALAANNFFRGLDAEAVKKQKEADLSARYAQDLAQAIQSKSKDAMARLDAQRVELDKLSEDKSGAPDDLVAAIRRDADAKQKEVNKVRDESAKIRDDLRGIESEITNLNHESGQTKNDQLKEGINSQIVSLKEESKTKEKDLAENDLKLGKLQKEAENLANQAYLVHQMNEQIKSGQVGVGTEPIDKDKLNAQISAYRKPDSSVSEVSVSAPDTAHTITEIKAERTAADGTTGSTAVKSEKETTASVAPETDAKYKTALNDAESKPTALAKEEARSEALRQWSDELITAIAGKKEELKKNPDKDKQQKLIDDITALEKEQQEKLQQASESTAKAEKLKNGSAEPASITFASGSNENYTKQYENKIAASNTLSKPSEKEAAKAEALKAWSGAIDTDISSKKQVLAQTSDPEKKTRLQEEIAGLEKESTSKKEQAQASLAAAESLKKEESAAPSSTTSITSVLDTEFNIRLNGSEKLPEGSNKDSAKAVVYTQWAESLTKNIEVKKQTLSGIKDPAEKKAMEQSISDLETERSGKLAAAAKSSTLADKHKRSITTTATDNSVADAPLPEPAVDYSAPDAIAADSEKKQLQLESIILKAKSDSLRKAAVSLSGDDKTIKLKEADDIETAAQNKQNDASSASGKANETELVLNERKVAAYVTQPGAASKPELSLAEALNLEANAYREKAKKSKIAADGKPNSVAKRDELRQARENERIALSKQNEALKIYEKAYPKLRLDPAILMASTSAKNKPGDNALNGKTHADSIASGTGSVQPTNAKIDTLKPNAVAVNNKTDNKASNAASTGSLAKTDTTQGSRVVEPAHPKIDSAATIATNAGTSNTGLSSEKEAELKKSDDYKKYLKLKAQIDRDQEAVTEDNTQSGDYQLKAQSFMKQGNELIASANMSADTSLKADAFKKAKEYDDLAALNFSKSDSAHEHARKRNLQIAEKRKNANLLLANRDPQERAAMMFMAEKESEATLASLASEPSTATASNTSKPSNNNGTKPKPKDQTKTNVNSGNTDNNNVVQSKPKDQTKTNSKSGNNTVAQNKPKDLTKVNATPGNNTLEQNKPKDQAKSNQVSANNGTVQNKTKSIPVKTENNGIVQNKPKDQAKASTTPDKTGKNSIAQNKSKDQTKTGVPDQTLASNAGKPSKTDNRATDSQPAKLNKKDVSAVISAREDFVITSSEAVPKVIPVDPKLPEGLIFKVQVGAFRKPISSDLFKGVSPLMGETTPQGFIRYTAGVFTRFESADKAKREVKAMGFNDAFVVAFLNGKRIPMEEALASNGVQNAIAETPNPVKIDTSVGPAGMPFRTVKNNNNTTGSNGLATNNTAGADSSAQPHEAIVVEPAHVNNAMPTVSKNAPEAIAKTTSVTEVKGVFYTVQVGVYSNPVSNGKLFGLQPLNTEKLPNNTLRYTTGQYSDLKTANEAKQRIVQLGIKDAFVVAYDNGKRIPLLDAKPGAIKPTIVVPPVRNTNEAPATEIQTPAPTTEATVIRPEAIVANNVPSSQVQATKGSSDYSRFESREVEEAKSDTGLVYKVQIGAFKEEVPLEIANKFLLLARRGVRNFKDENGLTVFTIGKTEKLEDAQFLKEEAIAKGITDAFVIALKGGKKIPLSDAKGNK